MNSTGEVNMFRHVNDPSFGLNSSEFDAEFERIRAATMAAGEKPDSVDVEMVMRAVYESAFRIHNHYTPGQHPWAMVAAHPKEDFLPYSSKCRDYATFIDERVFEATGIDMDRFFKRPRADIEMIMSLVRLRNKKHSGALDEALKQMGQK